MLTLACFGGIALVWLGPMILTSPIVDAIPTGCGIPLISDGPINLECISPVADGLLSKACNLITDKAMHLDAPRPWGIYFQDSATPQMEGLVELHDNILFYLVIILFGVG